VKNCDKCGQEILLPWENEPDELFFIDKETGYQCQILRRCKKTEYRMIYLCGYVKIPENHPFYNLEYSDKLISECNRKISIKGISYFICNDYYDYESPSSLLEIHGGITFSQFSRDDFLPDGFWYGFDCGHSGDISNKEDIEKFKEYVYRDIEYVKNECKSLARQLKSMESKDD
jgi:hypothetical protein